MDDPRSNDDASAPAATLLAGHEVPLGESTVVRRLLPLRQRRTVGAWCFVDHFGPEDVSGRPGMQVAPHPHTGLQTVTWLVDGVVEHRDSLGSHQIIRPGQLNLMTSGRGIAHSEMSPPDHPGLMHGLQLWVALPASHLDADPSFAHHAELPVVEADGAVVTVLVGEFLGAASPAVVHTPLMAAELFVTEPSTRTIDLRAGFEHALLAMSGRAMAAGQVVEPGSILHLPPGRSSIAIACDGPTRLVLLGGEPFAENLVMWWNFVGRSHEDVVQARDDWMAGRRFGPVVGSGADPLPAPPLPAGRLKARDRAGAPVDVGY